MLTAPAGGPLRHSTFRSRHWVDAVEAAKLPPVGLSVLRHSAAAALIRCGASPKAVQTVLGHASAAFTLTVYGHVFETDLDDVAARLEASLPSTMRDRCGTMTGPRPHAQDFIRSDLHVLGGAGRT